MKLLLTTTLLLAVAVGQSVAFLESLVNALESLKTYYTTEVRPYVSEGLKMAERAERFVDSAIGEECVYECPRRGQAPVRRAGHVQTSNGCGSLDWIFDDSEESLIHVEKSFTGCCDDHDLCYDTCNADKDECDLKFKKCLYRQCRGRDLDFIDSKKCKLKAKLFFVTVIGVGCQSYLDAQQNSCQCVANPKSEL